MTADHARPPTVPLQAWVLAWTSLAGQVLALLERGAKSEPDLAAVVSMALGGLVVGWVSLGVLRARTVRLVVAWLVLVVTTGAYVLSLVDSGAGGDDAGWLAVQLGITVVTMAALASFSRTPYFRGMRDDPRQRPPLAGLLTIAIVVGVLGGIVDPVGSVASVDVAF